MTLSERASTAIAHPLALPIYAAAAIIAHRLWGVEVVMVAVSHLSVGLLFLMTSADKRRADTMAREVDALADAHPEIDAKAIREMG